MGYVVLTGNEEFAKATKRQGGYELPVQVSSVVDETCWAIYEGDTRVTEPRPLTQTMRADIRTALRDLGVVPDASPVKAEPVAPVLATAPPARQPKASPPSKVQPAASSLTPYQPTTLTEVDEESGEIVTITEELRLEARAVHEDILHHGKQSAYHMFEFGRNLKHMRDSFLHLALGFRSFSAYCDDIKLSRSIASERIAAVETVQWLAESETVRPVERLSYINAVLASRARPEDVAAVAESHDITKLPKRDFEELLRQAKLDRELLEQTQKTLAALEARYQELSARPPAIVEKEMVVTKEVPVDNPAQQQRIESMHKEVVEKAQTIEQLQKKLAQVQKWQDDTAKDLKQLRERADRSYDLDQQIIVKEARAKELEGLIAQMQSIFEDGRRNVRGGPELMRILFPLDRMIHDIGRRVSALRKEGVGGPCEDGDLTRLSKLLRQLSNDLDAIVADRKTITINATPVVTEVQ